MSKTITTQVVIVDFPGKIKIDVYLSMESRPNQKLKKLTSLTNYIEKYNSGWKKRLELANVLYFIGDWLKAIKEYQTVLKKKPKLIKVWLQLGHIFHLTGAKNKAIYAYESALALSSHRVTQQQIKGLIKLCQRRYQNAIKEIQIATKINPNTSTHWLSLGVTYLQMESPVAALQAFEKFLKLKPNDIKGLHYSHDALLAMGKIKTAQKKLELARQLAPNNINVLERVINHRLRHRLVQDQEG